MPRSSSGNIEMVIIVGVISVIFGVIFIMLYAPLGKGQAQDLISTTAFTVTESIADSIDALAASDYNGTVKYTLPNADCVVRFYDRYVFSDISFESTFGDVGTSYGLFTNVEFTHPDSIQCSPGKVLLIRKEGYSISVEEA